MEAKGGACLCASSIRARLTATGSAVATVSTQRRSRGLVSVASREPCAGRCSRAKGRLARSPVGAPPAAASQSTTYKMDEGSMGPCSPSSSLPLSAPSPLPPAVASEAAPFSLDLCGTFTSRTMQGALLPSSLVPTSCSACSPGSRGSHQHVWRAQGQRPGQHHMVSCPLQRHAALTHPLGQQAANPRRAVAASPPQSARQGAPG